VDDVVQEVFLAALVHAGRFRGDASLLTWLTKIAVNKCRSHQRGLRVLWKRFVGGDPALDQHHAPRSDGPDEDTAANVREAVQALAPRDREVVVLRYFEEMTAGEIAALTGQSKNSVEVRLHRARAKLAGVLRGLVEDGNV
jgi:RNA polymerase sigma-70 factor (ECF subfamily)